MAPRFLFSPLSSLLNYNRIPRIAYICHSPTNIMYTKCTTDFPLLLLFLPPAITNSGSISVTFHSSFFLAPNNPWISSLDNIISSFIYFHCSFPGSGCYCFLPTFCILYNTHKRERKRQNYLYFTHHSPIAFSHRKIS